MITLYNETETDFSHNGIGILKDCISCELHRELNGLFSLELEYPNMGKYANKIEKFMIIKAPTPQGTQLFRIQERERDLDIIRIYATHIFYDLAKNFIPDTNIVGKTRVQAIQQILDKTLNKHKFVVEGNEGNIQNNCRIVRKNPINAMLGDEDNTIRSRWGLELDFDNYKIIAKEKIGQDNGVLIAYRKNLTGIHETLDMSEVATRIIPQGYNGLLLPEYCIDSPNIGAYYEPLVAHVKFEDIKVKENPEDEDGFATKEEAYIELRKQTQRLFTENKIDIPYFNYEIEFEELSKTEEYKQYKQLEAINIGDTVTVRHSELGLDLQGRMIAYDYDCILKKYIKIELGMRKKDLTLQIKQAVADIEFTKEKIEMEVSNLDKSMSSKLEITENNIRTEVNDINNNLTSKISQTASEIRSEVNDTKNELSSSISQTASNVETSVKGYVYDEVSDAKRYAESKINVQADRIDMLSDKVNINGTYFYSDGTMQTEGLRGDVINFNYGYSIDNRNGGIRLKYNDNNYVTVRDNGIAFYIDGIQRGIVDSGGFYNVRNGSRYKLAETGSTTVIPKFG